MKVKFYVSIGYADADHEDEVEFEDGTAAEEIEEAWKEWCQDYIDGYWKVVDDD